MPALPCARCTGHDATVCYEATGPLAELLSADSRLHVADSDPAIAIPLCEACHERLVDTLETLDGPDRSSKSIAKEELYRYAESLSISIINDASR